MAINQAFVSEMVVCKEKPYFGSTSSCSRLCNMEMMSSRVSALLDNDMWTE